MQIPKPSEREKSFFLSILPAAADVEVRPMFGNLGAFVNRNMFAGLFGPVVGVRLNATDSTELHATAGSRPFGPPERPMGGYIGLPEAWTGESEPAAEWVGRAYAHVAALPPKPIKATRTRGTRPIGGPGPEHPAS